MLTSVYPQKKIPYNGRKGDLKSGFEDAWDYATQFEDLARDVKLYSAKFLDVGAKQAKEWKDRSEVLDGDIKQLDLDLAR